MKTAQSPGYKNARQHNVKADIATGRGRDDDQLWRGRRFVAPVVAKGENDDDESKALPFVRESQQSVFRSRRRRKPGGVTAALSCAYVARSSFS